MRTIYKYPLSYSAVQLLELGVDDKILCAQLQHGILNIWVETDTEETETQITNIYIVGTGRSMEHVPTGAKYIDTVQVDEYVWHIYSL